MTSTIQFEDANGEAASSAMRGEIEQKWGRFERPGDRGPERQCLCRIFNDRLNSGRRRRGPFRSRKRARVRQSVRWLFPLLLLELAVGIVFDATYQSDIATVC